MRKRNTQKALLGSLTMMLLCFALLLGTTFAWFTDTVSSSAATIHSGNLDVELDYALQPASGGDLVWYNATDTTVDLFSGALWEPGYTGVVYLRVRNTGSLAVKYNYTIEVTENTLGKTSGGAQIDLTEYIKLTAVNNCQSVYPSRDSAKAAFAADAKFIGEILPPAAEGNGKTGVAFTSTTEGKLTGKNTDGDTSKPIAVIVHMPDSVGNAANHDGTNVPSTSLTLKIVATQDSVESDSFGTEYDIGAAYPANTTQTQSRESQTNEGQAGQGQTSEG